MATRSPQIAAAPCLERGKKLLGWKDEPAFVLTRRPSVFELASPGSDQTTATAFPRAAASLRIAPLRTRRSIGFCQTAGAALTDETPIEASRAAASAAMLIGRL